MTGKVASSDFFSDRLHFIEITNNTLLNIKRVSVSPDGKAQA
jgi:hypothetical protein